VNPPRPGGGATPGPFLVEGARRLGEWTRLTALLPSLEARVEVDAEILTRTLSSLPDEANGLLRLADGARTLRDLIDESGLDELAAAALLVRLHADGVLRVVPSRAPPPVEGTPAPDGVEWFADPAEARRAALAAEAALPLPDRARGPAPVRHSQAPRWVVGAVLVLAAAILLGPEWARRKRSQPEPEPGASPVAEPAAPAPPALAVTEPAPTGIRLPPSEPRPPPDYLTAMAEGEASHRSGDFLASAAAFRRAIAIRETAEAQASLGRALSDARQTDLALAAFRRATVLDASNGGAWLGLGEALMTLGDPAGARVAYERYLAVEPAGRQAGEVRSVLARLRP
jgi:tetratricopeptide (TPR) repeat protein